MEEMASHEALVSHGQTTSASRLSIGDYKRLLEVVWYTDRQICHSLHAFTVVINRCQRFVQRGETMKPQMRPYVSALVAVI